MSPSDYGPLDPRSRLAPAPAEAAGSIAGPAHYKEFSATTEGMTEEVFRGQNFVLQHVRVGAGSVLTRQQQPDEYVVLVPDIGVRVTVRAAADQALVTQPSLIVVPPGDSDVTAETAGRLVRLLTAASAPDLAAASPNAGGYLEDAAGTAPFEAWPAPAGGHRIRVYDLDVPVQPGRFGRIWRCSTFMINFLALQMGPRDPHQLSPHAHADFEQCSLALSGDFVHHLRWPWGPDRMAWRADRHIAAPSPSALIIPPTVVHTTEATGAALNQLVDIFCPPRMDFSQVPGWVLNHDDYPMPSP